MKLILNEREMLDKALKQGYIDDKPLNTIRVLCKYYFSIGQDKNQVYDSIDNFMTKNYKNYIMVDWKDVIKKTINSVYNRKDFSLYEVKNVVIYKKELDVIRTIKNERLEKLAFVLLAYAKLYNQINKNNKNWVNAPYDDVFADTLISANTEDKDKFVYKLKQLGLVKPSMRNDSENICVLFVEQDGEEVMVINDFRNFVYEYMRYCGERISKCEECGILIKLASGATKYCSKCAREVKLYQNMLWKRDYDKSRKIENPSNTHE